jgi:hypothetical protein
MADICKYETAYYLSILYQLQYFVGSYTEWTFFDREKYMILFFTQEEFC